MDTTYFLFSYRLATETKLLPEIICILLYGGMVVCSISPVSCALNFFGSDCSGQQLLYLSSDVFPHYLCSSFLNVDTPVQFQNVSLFCFSEHLQLVKGMQATHS